MDANRPLESLDSFVTRRRGTFFEAEIFHALRDCAFVLRSFEFALVDGALFATVGDSPPPGNYTERFWALNEQVRMTRGSHEHWARILVLLDLKSSTSRQAEEQVYITTLRQQEKTGIYIAVCAADLGYVEVIPNRFSDSSLSTSVNRKVAVNESRKSMLPPSAYGFLSPCNSPYRMPLSLLSRALESVQQCAQGHGDYINPWTGAQFTGWRPHITQGNESLAPVEDSQHYTSFKSLMDIWRGTRVARSRDHVDIAFEFMNLQPELADFKFSLPNPCNHNQRRQVFIQHKIDGLYRSPANLLTKVAIARNQRKGQIGYYFTEYARFDYLMYQFNYVDQQKRSTTKFFFLPECKIPDEFYQTLSKEGDFSRDQFRGYWITMDVHGEWLHRIIDIINATPNPRKPGNRPCRPADPTEKPPTVPRPPFELHYVELFFRRIFYALMSQCAARLSGLIVVLSRVHPMGDFAYCRYTWTTQEQEAFFSHQTVPCTITQLPSSTPIVPLQTYTRKREATSRGPCLTASEFQRLNMWPQPRLLIFDLFGQEGASLCSPLLVIPSDDIRPTTEQVALFHLNSSKDKSEEFESRAPLLAELLYTGLNPIDYTISTGGPLLFEPDTHQWEDLWKLLERMSRLENFTYPHNSNIARSPATYRVDLKQVHQCLVDRHALIEKPVLFSEDGEYIAAED
ncbi:hypothetical protein HBH98_172240 [Parastagonospora nodorum]|nr:hypothetical protein HBH52_180450 [Parastagonospora nodorum]KAH3991341.1 hypothetical protein HBI10_235610 [Parastagonospora nodorum]KAH4008860.1 hypothetical protein HBI13_227240 [Parastagonospora nodorum]KAH4101279.1 hypothetical protein HBH46_143130 [Parastagonospora nodorum]KAH4163700.1 hypothetical protein HBH43_154000 [Parastagonospora nodorum]